MFSCWRRVALAALGGLALLAAGWSLVRWLTPDRHILTMVMPRGDQHQRLARVLAEHAATHGVELRFVETNGETNDEANDEWRMTNDEWKSAAARVRHSSFGTCHSSLSVTGRADLRLLSGAPKIVPDVEEVVLLQRETLHMLVRPELAGDDAAGLPTEISILRGRRVNLGPAHADWRAAAEVLFTFAGLSPGEDFAVTSYDEQQLATLPAAELPDAVVTVGGCLPAEAAYLVRAHGYRPLALPFIEALAQLEPQLGRTTLPAALYAVDPPMPPAAIDALTVDLRLVARTDASERAVRTLLGAIFDGAFAQQAGLPNLDERDLTADRRMKPHAGAIAFAHRHDPWLTPDRVMETEDLRNLIAATVFGGLLVWRWLRRRRSRVVETAVERVHALEREALQLEVGAEADAGGLARLRRELAHVKRELVEQTAGRERFDDPLLADLLRHIDALRHLLVEMTAHRRHLWPAVETNDEWRMRNDEWRSATAPVRNSSS